MEFEFLVLERPSVNRILSEPSPSLNDMGGSARQVEEM